ncbi:hypothetical protein RH915_09040 [Serpentinicella sp. ANB-PHB4]|uniref:hypothetical protein n=1 Tax=Serpentinicella sp. ANB-PHB4 TaxID=3074076 RepID=UPI002863BF2F|nr:hypothetical protein [Serpentinicella sp. ANB-PHB4]MDR5659639.1 hypothetical protein [Serpentinicella sp. ANB-PHB4]
MPEIINNKGDYALDFIMIPSEHIGEFNDFMTQYGDLSDYDLFNEILVTKNEVSQSELQSHIKNLDALSQMDGFVNDFTRQRIELVKEVLNTDSSTTPQSKIEKQFLFGGSSLLLWFLTLAAIWRRPFRGPRFRRPGFW